MTINDQHIALLAEARREASELVDCVDRLRALLSEHTGPRNDPHSTQISMLTAETMRSIMRASTSSNLLERLLRIVRIKDVLDT